SRPPTSRTSRLRLVVDAEAGRRETRPPRGDRRGDDPRRGDVAPIGGRSRPRHTAGPSPAATSRSIASASPPPRPRNAAPACGRTGPSRRGGRDGCPDPPTTWWTYGLRDDKQRGRTTRE